MNPTDASDNATKPVEAHPTTGVGNPAPAFVERRLHSRGSLLDRVADATYTVLRHYESTVEPA